MASMSSESPPDKLIRQLQAIRKQAPAKILGFSTGLFNIKAVFFHIDCHITEEYFRNLYPKRRQWAHILCGIVLLNSGLV